MATIEIDDETYEEHDKVRQHLGVSWEQYLDIGVDKLLRVAIDANNDQPAGDEEITVDTDTEEKRLRSDYRQASNNTERVKMIIDDNTDEDLEPLSYDKLIELAKVEYGWTESKTKDEVEKARQKGHLYEPEEKMFATT